MADPKGHTLLVNLAASQTRRRLKGFGHGVRKVQSAGRNQALIIHTATGQHLAELEARFADVGYSTDAGGLSEPVDNLRHLGPAAADWLREVGIRTVADLERLGPAAAYRRVKQQHPEARRALLWTLAAALSGRDPETLTAPERQKLLGEAGEP
jgi:DNA transformation protein and related proteins